MAAIAEKLTVRAREDWGVQPVPQERRVLRPFDFAVLWGDLAVSLLVMVAGTLLVPGLGAQQALLAIVIGTPLGTALLEIISMAQAARALSEESLGFSGYYFWIVVFGVVGTLMGMGGPIVVVRQW